MGALDRVAQEDDPWVQTVGDDLIWEITPDDTEDPGSTARMQTWSDPVVEIRDGPTSDSNLLASTRTPGDGDTFINIITAGHVFSTRVVAATDFSLDDPIMTWVILRADSPHLGSTREILRYIECEVLIDGVARTVVPSRPLLIRPQLAVRP